MRPQHKATSATHRLKLATSVTTKRSFGRQGTGAAGSHRYQPDANGLGLLLCRLLLSLPPREAPGKIGKKLHSMPVCSVPGYKTLGTRLLQVTQTDSEVWDSIPSLEVGGQLSQAP